MEDEDQTFLAESSSSMASLTLGRLISSLLAARPRKLNDAVSRLSSDSRSSPSIGSLDESLWFVHKHVKECAEKTESLDDILIPMLEHTLRSKDVKSLHGGQSMVLLNWLFQDEILFDAISTSLSKIIATKDDRFIVLGWCVLVRGLVEFEHGSEQYPMNGIRQRRIELLNTLSSCIPYLGRIVCQGSKLQDGFELPSRLAVAAADCFLSLTESLTKLSSRPSNKQKLSDLSKPSQWVSLLATSADRDAIPGQKLSEYSDKKLESLLWEHLAELIRLVERLLVWNQKSRPLHFKGLEQVLKWLNEIKAQYGHPQSGSEKTGMLLLTSCWKHYSVLLCLEDHKGSHQYKELLEQYLSGLKYFTDNHGREPSEDKQSGIETRKFFLNCLCLLLGRFDRKRFERIISEDGTRIIHVVLPQLHCSDDEVIEGVVCILKTFIFKPQSSSGNSHGDDIETDAMLPLLIHLLDEQDGTAKAAVKLLAEYCLMSKERHCLQEVLQRLASETVQQRKNAIAVIAELINSITVLPKSSRQDIADHLLDRLDDEDIVIREQASSLLLMIDPSMVLPSLVHLVLSTNQRVKSASSDALLRVLKDHSQNGEVICMLLDCLISISQSPDLQNDTGDSQGSKLVCDQVLALIPEWSRSVPKWDVLIGPLIDKMFSHPTNATIVRFFSHISKHLAEAADTVLYHVLLHTKRQTDVNEYTENRTRTSEDSAIMQQSLFENLCPLLIIRMLPLSCFNDLNSSNMYGQIINQAQNHGDAKIFSNDGIANLLFKRAFDKFEFEDVRKLAAELCGRIHPQVLVPIVSSHLEQAISSRDIPKMKTCLFSLCTSLMVRAGDTVSHPAMLGIRKSLENVLLWPSLDGDEVSRAQHGCIDCLALMICAELQAPKSSNILGKNANQILANASSRDLVLNYVIIKLTSSDNDPVSTSFRLCMANILISACQKIPDSSKKRYAKRILPRLIPLVETITESDIRAACIQVLFSAVYHLKSPVYPYAPDLLKLSIKALKKGSEKEKLAGAKLMASLMGSDDEILENISTGITEARSVLSSLSLTDPSLELRNICSKLLACITFP